MKGIWNWALALALLLLACSAWATVCYTDQRYRYGVNSIQEAAGRTTARLRAQADGQIARHVGATHVCWAARRTEMDDSYCKLYFSGQNPLAPGRYFGTLVVGVALDAAIPTVFDGKSYAAAGPGHIYNIRTIEEIWEINEWTSLGLGQFVRKVDGTLGYPQRIGLCWKNPTTISYLNGVFTTQFGAQESLDALEAEFGEKSTDTSLNYMLLYNQTACKDDSKLSCLADLAEVFEQRQGELNGRLQNKWELFWDTLAGRQRRPDSSSAGLFAGFGEILSSLEAALRNKMVALTTSLAGRTTLKNESMLHMRALVPGTRNDPSNVVVAHSQGNLFVDEINKNFPPSPHGYDWRNNPNLAFIHVAPPNTVLNGEYVLGDTDLVVRSLGGLVPNSTPTANVLIPMALSDITGHGFLETYWDKSRPAFPIVRNAINNAINSR